MTTLNPDYPLIRFATGDLSAVMAGESPCGRTNIRIKGWMGRADQTTKIKGMFVRPEQVADLVASHEGIARARVVASREDEKDVLTVQIETTATDAAGFETVIQSTVKMKGTIELVDLGALPRDGLVIGGWEKPHGVRRLDGSDYALLSGVIKATETAIEHDDGTVSITAIQPATIDKDQDKEPKLPPKKPVDDTADWLFRPAPMDDKSGRPIRPSQPGLDHDPQSLAAGVAKQNAQSRQIGLAYGKLAHRLLEQLPATDAAVRRDRAVQIAGQSRDVPDAMAASLIDKLLTLIDLPAFAPLFSKDALVEVPINGRLNGIGIAGQIDRLFIDDKRIILADFKTGQPPENAIPRSYLHQMPAFPV